MCMRIYPYVPFTFATENFTIGNLYCKNKRVNNVDWLYTDILFCKFLAGTQNDKNSVFCKE